MGQRRAVLGVLVGAAVMAGVALGAGSASAADGDPCTVLGAVGVASGSDCVDRSTTAVLGPLVAAVGAAPPGGSAATSPAGGVASSDTTPASSGTTGGVVPGVGGVTAPVVLPGTGSSTTGSSTGDPAVVTAPRGTRGQPRAVGPAPAPAAPAPLSAPAPVGTPAAALPRPATGVAAPAALPAPALLAPAPIGTAGLAGLAGSGSLSPALVGAGYDASRLFAGAPATPLATLLAGDPALSATTASQVQAMALEGTNGTPGTPVTLGVLAVAALAGLGVRYRVTSRLRGRERDTHPELAESGTAG